MKVSYKVLVLFLGLCLVPLCADTIKSIVSGDAYDNAGDKQVKTYSDNFPYQASTPINIHADGFSLVADSGSLLHDLDINVAFIPYKGGTPLPSDMENVTGNFYGALTSTFWGLIFAIGFKFADGLIAPEIEGNEKSVKMYLENIMSASEKNDTSGKTVTVQAEENDAASEPDISVVSPERPDDTGPMPYSTGEYGEDEE